MTREIPISIVKKAEEKLKDYYLKGLKEFYGNTKVMTSDDFEKVYFFSPRAVPNPEYANEYTPTDLTVRLHAFSKTVQGDYINPLKLTITNLGEGSPHSYTKSVRTLSLDFNKLEEIYYTTGPVFGQTKQQYSKNFNTEIDKIEIDGYEIRFTIADLVIKEIDRDTFQGVYKKGYGEKSFKNYSSSDTVNTFDDLFKSL